MMQKLYLLMLTLVFMGCWDKEVSAQTKDSIVYYPNGVIKEKRVYHNTSHKVYTAYEYNQKGILVHQYTQGYTRNGAAGTVVDKEYYWDDKAALVAEVSHWDEGGGESLAELGLFEKWMYYYPNGKRKAVLYKRGGYESYAGEPCGVWVLYNAEGKEIKRISLHQCEDWKTALSVAQEEALKKYFRAYLEE